MIDCELALGKEKWQIIISHIKWTARYVGLDITCPYWQEKLRGEMFGYKHIRQSGVLSGAQPLPERGKKRTL
uniref:Uncharacterized protein n=1 Tax=viral metagenome TaxID=1070528 RepID=A0A6M3IX02_9ZZZZ